jgi:putative transposase
MKKSKFTETQIVAILQSADAGKKVKYICREYGISDAMHYKWKSKHGGMEASDPKRVKEFEQEKETLPPLSGRGSSDRQDKSAQSVR